MPRPVVASPRGRSDPFGRERPEPLAAVEKFEDAAMSSGAVGKRAKLTASETSRQRARATGDHIPASRCSGHRNRPFASAPPIRDVSLTERAIDQPSRAGI